MSADPRVEAVAEALHASEHAGEMTRSCPAWDDAAIAVDALDAYDFGDETPQGAIKATRQARVNLNKKFEADLRERIARDIEKEGYEWRNDDFEPCSRETYDAFGVSAGIARGQA